jgi:hypothetical protein
LSQDILPSIPADQGEDNWDTVGGATERSLSSVTTVEGTVPKVALQVTVAGKPQVSSEAQSPL